MNKTITLALDAMGGDTGPTVVVPGAALALVRHPGCKFQFFGDESKIAPLLDGNTKLKQASTIHHCEVTIGMDEKPSQALRRGRYKSGMWKAIEAVRDGTADAAISAGNTGALMAMARFVLKTIPGIDRPAIAAMWPTQRNESIVLDVGATVGANARQLIEFAIMGQAMASCLFNMQAPTVGLLNIGTEEVKGNEAIKEAARLIRDLQLPIAYHGFVEGDDIGKGTVDVVVTEGFTGNVALKTAEGTAKQIASFLRASMSSSLMSKIGAMFASSAFDALKERMDPRKHNGGVFLGLNGVVVKSHGGTDSIGFATAIGVGIDMVRDRLVEKIVSHVADVNEKLPKMQAAAE